MIEIEGKVNKAICYATNIEDKARAQIKAFCDTEASRGCKIRIMPDVHAGKGCTIGTTMSINGRVVPNIVGVDIGCGMYTAMLNGGELDLRRVDEACHNIPSGFDVWDNKIWDFDLTRLRCFDGLNDIDRLGRSLGTLGGGNHFIEVERNCCDIDYLVIHSGSRNLGKQVAEYYQKKAIEYNNGRNGRAEGFMIKALIEEYKAAGREKDIENAIKELKRQKLDVGLPNELCYLCGAQLEDYLHDIKICQEFARINREKIAEKIVEQVGAEHGIIHGFHTIHNYIDTEEMILRKGAIAAHYGELLLIPMNMRDGSILGVGKGNAAWNFSAPHGAGRIMSRKKAKSDITLEEYKESMQGIYSSSVNISTLDEAPMAYKPMEDIIDNIKDTVNIVDILKPVFNFKASEVLSQ